jgi:hypothetical protein
LFVTKLVTKVTEVADLYAIHLKTKHNIIASLAATSFIMVASNTLEFYSFNPVYTGLSNYLRPAPNDRHIVMVSVLMANGNNISRFGYFAIAKATPGSIRVSNYFRFRI